MSKPTLSLCIPAYNAAAYLPRLLTSAQNQHIPFDEILVYDDCSSDNTAEIAEQYGAKVIRGEVNMGCSTGKNRLAEITSSDWIHFHDADDDLLPNFTQIAGKWISLSEPPDIVLMHYEYRDFSSGELLGQPSYDRNLLKTDPILASIRYKMVNFALIRRTAFVHIGGFETETKVLYNEDRAFYTKAAIQGLTFDYEPTLTCINFRHSASMSASNIQKCAHATFQVWKNVANQVEKKYHPLIAAQLWHNATYASNAEDWATIRLSSNLAKKLGVATPLHENKLFQIAVRMNPIMAFWLREQYIRIFRPHLRKHA